MIPPLPSQLVTELACRRRRFHYYLWHRVRNSWLRLTESERRAVRDIDAAWEPPRPALDAWRRPLRGNDSGEDFLFMHRQMIALANDILEEARDPSYPRVEGWRRVPPPGDAAYPVPEFPESELEEVKSAEYFERVIAPWERQYGDPAYLKAVTLGQLGSDIEFTINNVMHMRWAAPSLVGYRLPTAVREEIDGQWDAPAYDYLGDTYSSHVNPIFWKIHGWIYDRVEDWKRAHAVAGEIALKGEWVGPATLYPRPRDAPGGGTAAQSNDAPDEFLLIDRIISSSSSAGEFDGFFRAHGVRLASPRQGPR